MKLGDEVDTKSSGSVAMLVIARPSKRCENNHNLIVTNEPGELSAGDD
jgi:hypothetical protein